MKIALIPPTPELRSFPSTGVHLVLSHLLKDKQYKEYYVERRKWDEYLILDNSAHEFGVGNKPEQLLKQAKALRAQEIVCPDVLFDANGTIEATRALLRYIEKRKDLWEAAGEPRLMVVPQGNDRTQWVKCLNNLLKAWDSTLDEGVPLGDPIIGVSKDYDIFVKGGISTLIREYCSEYDVHCLGWPTDLWSLAKVVQECPWVRSTDSAKPFVYARASILLEPGGTVPPYPRRGAHYFQAELNYQQREIAARNIRVFDAAATNALILA